MDQTTLFYSKPSYAVGEGVIFSGARRQRGGSILGAFKSVVTPVLTRIGRVLKKNVTQNAFGFAKDFMGDVVNGRNIKRSLINRAKQRGVRTATDTLSEAIGFQRRNNVKRGGVKNIKKMKNTSTRNQRGSGTKS